MDNDITKLAKAVTRLARDVQHLEALSFYQTAQIEAIAGLP